MAAAHEGRFDVVQRLAPLSDVHHLDDVREAKKQEKRKKKKKEGAEEENDEDEEEEERECQGGKSHG